MITGQASGSSEVTAEKPNTLQGVTVANDYYHLTLFNIEIHITTRQDLLPDPDIDQVTAIVYAVHHEGPKQNSYGIICVDPTLDISKRNLLQTTGCNFGVGDIMIIQTETELFESLIGMVQDLDPDILLGYDTQRSSWGFLCRRGATLNINLAGKISRMPELSGESRFAGPNG